MKTKSGEKISMKEFFARWKQGIESITPYQKLQNDVRGTFISLLGYAFAFGAVIWNREAIGLLAYGLILIFLGTTYTTALKWISLRQQLKLLSEYQQFQIPLFDSQVKKESVPSLNVPSLKSRNNAEEDILLGRKTADVDTSPDKDAFLEGHPSDKKEVGE